MTGTHTTVRTAPRWRTRLATVVATGGLAVAALVFTAPVANAAPIKESTIKSECKAAGGTYASSLSNGQRRSLCLYTDVDGDRHDDHYVNGHYIGTVDQPQ